MTSDGAIAILLNGEAYELPGQMRIADLIERLEMKPSRVAVEVNRCIIPRADYPAVALKPGDQVEIVNFVGGG